MAFSNSFGFGCCSGSVPVTPPVTVPNCNCPVPSRLMLTSPGDGCATPFPPGTISYQPIPSWYADSGTAYPDGKVFFSDQEFTDSLGRTFYYQLRCQSNSFTLYLVYYPGIGGDEWTINAVASWLLGSAGNSCSPFFLHNSVVAPGIGCANGGVHIDPAAATP